MEVTINGNEIKSIGDFHQKIKQLLDLPDYYGENLDALWDCLTGWIQTPLTIVWISFEESRKNLGDFADKIINVFNDAEKEIEGFKVEYR